MRDDLDIPMPAMGPTGSATATYRVPRHRDEGMDPNTKRLAMIAAAIGGTLVVLFSVWSFTGTRRAGVPVVEADTRPLRVKPDNAGGMQVAGKDEAILSGKADGQAALAPPSETPAPQALKPNAPVVAAQAAATIAPVVAPATATSPARPSGVALAPPEAKPAPAKPLQTTAPAAAKPAPVASAPAHGATIQLAAVGSEQAALSEWQRLEKKMPDLLGGRKPAVSKTERDGKVFWRLRTGGFADATAAKSFCDQIKAKGGGCSVAAF